MLIGKPLLLTGDAKGNLATTADLLADFVSKAKRSLHIAIYDFRLKTKDSLKFVEALEERANHGVEVRIAYDHRNPPSVQSADKAFGLGDDPAPRGTHEFLTQRFPSAGKVRIQAVGLPSKAIAGSKLMHSKYIIRDGHTPDAAVLMGSLNFTDDAWALQDNNVLMLASPHLSAFYETDFQELWATGTINGTGVNDYGSITVDGLNGEIAFSPGEGRRIDAEIAGLIRGAKHSLHIASMLITSDTILAALNEVLEAGRVPIKGIYDGPQMSEALKQMEKSPRSAAKVAQIQALQEVLTAKRSTPYSTGGPHNFMHNKLLVADDCVHTGSYNFSLSAEHNAENAIVLRDPALAGVYRKYVEDLSAWWLKHEVAAHALSHERG
jgi:phosphatidylserine/phosphatidylglycerophosphate/cardiolipin synthase-like enzyme